MSTSDLARSGPSRRARDLAAGAELQLCGWLAAGLVVWPVSAVHGPRTELLAMSLLSLAQGVWFFWADGGGRRVTPVGVYSYAFALFVGYAGIYLQDSLNPVDDVSFIAAAVVAAYFTQVYVVVGMPQPVEEDRPRRDRPEVARWGLLLGVVLTAAGTGAALAGLTLGGVVDATAFSGVTVLAVALFRPQAGGPGLLLRGVMVAVAFAVYVRFVFDGFGRLTIGALGIAVILAVSSGRQVSVRSIKLLTLVVSVPTLMVLAVTRVQFTGQLNPNQGNDVTGFESVASPLERFGQLLSGTDRPPLHYGQSFVASATVFVPRSVWPDKPIGLGADLAHFYRPDLDGTGHSELALLHGEWVYNFGLVGLVAMALVMRLVLRRLNEWQVLLDQRSWTARRVFLLQVMLILVVSGFPDLFWGGTFTFMSRSGFRLVVVAVVLVLLGMSPEAREPMPPRQLWATAPPEDAQTSGDSGGSPQGAS
ncbi:MAG: hypothetical protein ACXVGR_03820 [Mycobacteriaceae bacterium]